MSVRIGIIAAALAALLAMGLGGCGRFHHHTPQERADCLVQKIVARLDLDQGQQQQLKRIEGEVLAKGAEMRAHREGDFAELIALLKSDQIDPTRFKIDVDLHQARAHELVAFIGEKFREFHDLLTPEQRQKAAQLLEEWRARPKRP